MTRALPPSYDTNLPKIPTAISPPISPVHKGRNCQALKNGFDGQRYSDDHFDTADPWELELLPLRSVGAGLMTVEKCYNQHLLQTTALMEVRACDSLLRLARLLANNFHIMRTIQIKTK